MFGALRITGTIPPQQSALYRASFCASCHALRELGGRLASCTTSYDMTVLTLVLAGLEGGGVVRRACTALPFRGVSVQQLSPDARALVAALNLAAVGAKLRDDLLDERRLSSRIGLRILASRERRALATLRRLGFDATLVEELPRRQAALERRTTPDLDALARPSAELSAEAFACAARVAGRGEHALALHAFGDALGRFVYVFDALVDRDEDRRRGRFNALVASGTSDAHAALCSQLTCAEQALARVPLAAHGELLAALLRSLRARVAKLAPRNSEAGAIDCACEACSAADCGACYCDVGACRTIKRCWRGQSSEDDDERTMRTDR